MDTNAAFRYILNGTISRVAQSFRCHRRSVRLLVFAIRKENYSAVVSREL